MAQPTIWPACGGLKLAISGKGGVGKSTVAGTLARLWAADGHRVLAVDADPDANLASAIGLPPELRGAIRTIATERQLIEERTGAKVREFGQMFKLNPEVADIAGRYAVALCGCRSAGAGRGAARRRRLRLPGERAAEEPGSPPGAEARRDRDPRHGSRHRAPRARHRDGRRPHAGGGRARPAQRGDRAARARDGAALGIRRFGVVLNKSADAAADSRWIAAEFGSESLLGYHPLRQPHRPRRPARHFIARTGASRPAGPVSQTCKTLCITAPEQGEDK